MQIKGFSKVFFDMMTSETCTDVLIVFLLIVFVFLQIVFQFVFVQMFIGLVKLSLINTMMAHPLSPV